MACLVAFLLGSSEKTMFERILIEYAGKLKTSKEDKDEHVLFNRWMDSLGPDLQAAPRRLFIPQCEAAFRHPRAAVKKSVCGTVTSVLEGGGLIDEHIFFSLDLVNTFDSNDAAKVGDKVHVDAEKLGKNGGWKATSVTKLKRSDSAGRKAEWRETGVLDTASIIACVTDLDDETCSVEHGLTFLRKALCEGYVPVVGDWLRLEASEDGKVNQAEPLRSKEMTGKVTQTPRCDKNGTSIGKGIINNEVQFSLDACEDEYKPWRDDEVHVTAVECRHNWCTWRAISVKLICKGKKQGRGAHKFESSGWVLRGGYPEMSNKRSTIPSFLPRYPIPENIKERVEKGQDILSLLPALRGELSLKNYTARFSALIYLEEIHADIEIRKHGIRGACLERRGGYLCLHVPGIVDGRPSLSTGDIVVLHEPIAASSSMEYHGFIHHILLESEEIVLKFHGSFQDNFEPSSTYDVEFKYSRSPFRRCHFAVRLAQRRSWSDLLFPEKIVGTRPQCNVKFVSAVDGNMLPPKFGMKKVPFYNTKLNPRQQQAVEQILSGRAICYPYILFGPPGTGKTVTLVEAILHIYCLLKWSRILVCAPSNSAVDVICERLARTGVVKEGNMVRFNAIRRPESSISEAIAKYCHSEEEVGKTSQYRIILTTCVNSGVFYSLQLQKDHFTHVCIDEAGQATEPELLIPIGLQTNGQVIMAGDPEQLGPVIMSPLANTFGLNMSLLERLMRLPVYNRNPSFENGYNPLIVTKLINNYRSHPQLLELPSILFYMGELVPCAERFQYHSLLNWEYLPKKGFPVIFHGIVSQHVRESDSPSLMNPAEIVQAIRYIKLLIRDENVAAEDIGVLTPYKKQVEKFRMMLCAVGIEGVKVGSVEEFQGQERSVIIISTVRSSPNMTALSSTNACARGALGFLSNYKRFNVATTRAKILMVVMGNPFVLSIDPHWKELLKYCVSHGGYVGCEIPN